MQASFFERSSFDHTDMMTFLEELAKEYPFLDLSYLGSSILGKAIPKITLGTGKRTLLYVGAHHGMEWITSMILCRFLLDFCRLYQEKGAIRHVSAEAIWQMHRIFVIPMLNPDGTDYQIHGVQKSNPLHDRALAMNSGNADFSRWQANARGVDLNHNYDAGFWEYKKHEVRENIFAGPTRYSGEFPESEPEVAALCNFIRFLGDLRGILTLHTQGEEIFYKSGGRCLRNSTAVAKRISKESGYRLSEATGLASFGGLTDWCVQGLGIPSFTLECGKGENPLPASDAFSIYATLRSTLFLFPTWI